MARRPGWLGRDTTHHCLGVALVCSMHCFTQSRDKAHLDEVIDRHLVLQTHQPNPNDPPRLLDYNPVSLPSTPDNKQKTIS